MTVDQYRPDPDDSTEDEQTDDSDEGKSVSNVRLNSRDHPEGYKALYDKGPIRQWANSYAGNTKTLFNDLLATLGEVMEPGLQNFDETDPLPLMEWFSVGPRDMVNYCRKHGLGEVSEDNGDLVITFPTKTQGDTDSDEE